MNYCDSSFLLALYLPGDFFHPHARRLAARFKEAIPFSLLAELEVTNSIRRALRESAISQAEHDAAFRQIEADLADGILTRRATPQAELYRIASGLSRQHTPSIPARSLDILQTAAAILIGADAFYTFDLRQRQLATACGLKVQPATMPKPSGK